MEHLHSCRWGRRPRIFANVSLGALILAAAANASFAKAPRVEFDMPLVVACRDVTTDEFAMQHPEERLIQANFDISALLLAGAESDLLEFEYRFRGGLRRLRVFDYQPRTTLASDFAGGVQYEEKQETSKSAGLAVSGAWEHVVKATGSGDIGSKTTNVKRYELVAPLAPIVSSGTIMSGYGVTIKLRPSRTTTLEGAHPFSLTWRVPATWRADVLEATCQARGYDRGVVKQLDERVVVGGARFRVAIHMLGDEAARRAGEDLILADRHLRTLAAANQDELRRRSYPTVIHEIGGALDVIQPRISESWLDQLTSGAFRNVPAGTYRRLPRPVQAAAADYVTAHRHFAKTIGSSR